MRIVTITLVGLLLALTVCNQAAETQATRAKNARIAEAEDRAYVEAYVQREISDLAAKTGKCSTKPILTDKIIIQEGNKVRVVTFKMAWKMGKTGKAWILLFCE